MANNRMYLTHMPTGDSVYLGKRQGEGWHDVPSDLSEQVLKLFSSAYLEGVGLDDFAISMEESTSALVNTDWKQCEKVGDFLNLSAGE
jgi:hypothetical protein